jgi:hypothetical protein
MNYASDDAQTAYLFQCGTEQLFAVSLDKTGARLPRSSCTQGWILREEFQLGVQHPVPAAIARPSQSFEASLHRATTFGAPVAPVGPKGHPNRQRPTAASNNPAEAI